MRPIRRHLLAAAATLGVLAIAAPVAGASSLAPTRTRAHTRTHATAGARPHARKHGRSATRTHVPAVARTHSPAVAPTHTPAVAPAQTNAAAPAGALTPWGLTPNSVSAYGGQQGSFGCGSNAPNGNGPAGGTLNQVCGGGLTFIGPSVGQIATVIGPTIIGSTVVGPVTTSAGPVRGNG